VEKVSFEPGQGCSLFNYLNIINKITAVGRTVSKIGGDERSERWESNNNNEIEAYNAALTPTRGYVFTRVCLSVCQNLIDWSLNYDQPMHKVS